MWRYGTVLDMDDSDDYYLMVSECYMNEDGIVRSYTLSPTILEEESPASFILSAVMIFESVFHPTLFWNGRGLAVSNRPIVEDDELFKMTKNVISTCRKNKENNTITLEHIADDPDAHHADFHVLFSEGRYVIKDDSIPNGRLSSHSPTALSSYLCRIPLVFDKNVYHSCDGRVIDTGRSLLDISNMDRDIVDCILELVEKIRKMTDDDTENATYKSNRMGT